MKIQKHVLLIWLVWSVVQIAGAESLHKLTSYKRYIHEYKSLAIEQQHKYKIPASITLAQGLLESGAGQSDLARRSNNHFGIKISAITKAGPKDCRNAVMQPTGNMPIN